MAPRIRVINKDHQAQVEDYAIERLQLALGRFDDRLSSIDVHVRDNNADKGGIDKHCSIDAHLIPRGTLHVQATERDVHEAINKAIHRMETVVAKSVDRGHRATAIRHAGGGLRRESNRAIEREVAEEEQRRSQ